VPEPGRTGHGANVLGSKGPPGFESLPLRLRHDVALAKSEFAKSTPRLRRDTVRQIKIMYYVYSLKCKDGYYIGCTDNIQERIERHQKGHVPATANLLPINLEFYFAIENKYKAFNFEKYLKSGSGRAFINKHLI